MARLVKMCHAELPLHATTKVPKPIFCEAFKHIHTHTHTHNGPHQANTSSNTGQN